MDDLGDHKLDLSATQQAGLVRWAFGLFGRKPSDEDCTRPVFAVAYPGCYGIAGYVFTVDGSPPRATIVIEPGSGTMFAMQNGRTVRGGRTAATRVAMDRYRAAIDWLNTLGLPVPALGF